MRASRATPQDQLVHNRLPIGGFRHRRRRWRQRSSTLPWADLLTLRSPDLGDDDVGAQRQAVLQLRGFDHHWRFHHGDGLAGCTADRTTRLLNGARAIRPRPAPPTATTSSNDRSSNPQSTPPAWACQRQAPLAAARPRRVTRWVIARFAAQAGAVGHRARRCRGGSATCAARQRACIGQRAVALAVRQPQRRGQRAGGRHC